MIDPELIADQSGRTPYTECCLCNGPIYRGEPVFFSHTGIYHAFIYVCDFQRELKAEQDALFSGLEKQMAQVEAA